MSIADIKTGGWITDEQLTPAQMNLTRAELLKCVDGAGGGTYTPSATVSISDLTVGGGNRLKYNSRSVTRMLHASIASTTLGDWTFDEANLNWEQSAGITGDSIWFQVDLPASGTLTSVKAYFFPAVVARGAAPTTLPRVGVSQKVQNASGASSLGATTYTYTTSGAYEVANSVETTMSTALLPTATYYVFFRGEAAGGAALGLRLLGFDATVTMTEQGEW